MKPIYAIGAVIILWSSALLAGDLTDNLDGTVTDLTTGLIWQKCTYGQTYGGNCSGSGGSLTNWQAALNYCHSLSLASRAWRLPSINELKSIVDSSRSPLSIDPTFGILYADYWTSTTMAGNSSQAWYIVFYSYGGDLRYQSKTTSGLVARCVSGP